VFALVAIAIGAFLGSASGGTVRSLTEVTLKGEGLILVLFALQAIARGRGVPMVVGASAGTFIWVALSLVLAAILSASGSVPGTILMGVGIGLNVLVVLANGFMPVSADSGAAIGHSLSSVATDSHGMYAMAGANTLLEMLGDTLPVSMLGIAVVLSAGDVLLAIGVIELIARSMMGPSSGISRRNA
jgi:hypothetical protein